MIFFLVFLCRIPIKLVLVNFRKEPNQVPYFQWLKHCMILKYVLLLIIVLFIFLKKYYLVFDSAKWKCWWRSKWSWSNGWSVLLLLFCFLNNLKFKCFVFFKNNVFKIKKWCAYQWWLGNVDKRCQTSQISNGNIQQYSLITWLMSKNIVEWSGDSRGGSLSTFISNCVGCVSCRRQRTWRVMTVLCHFNIIKYVYRCVIDNRLCWGRWRKELWWVIFPFFKRKNKAVPLLLYIYRLLYIYFIFFSFFIFFTTGDCWWWWCWIGCCRRLFHQYCE